jgi:hypothetical protein
MFFCPFSEADDSSQRFIDYRLWFYRSARMPDTSTFHLNENSRVSGRDFALLIELVSNTVFLLFGALYQCIYDIFLPEWCGLLRCDDC